LDYCELLGAFDSDTLSLWFADGTNYAGQDNVRGRKRRIEENMQMKI